MRTDTEIQLGVIGPEAIDALAAALGLTVFDHDEDAEASVADLRSWPELGIEIDTDPVAPALEAAYKATLARLGWTFRGKTPDGLYEIDTPFGRRQTAGFQLAFRFYPDEVDGSVDEATLGIALSARYFPVILDVESPNGARNIETSTPLADICRQEIARQLPPFQDSSIFLRNVIF